MRAPTARYRVARADELTDGEMRVVTAGSEQVLLVRLDGRLYAFTASCPHHQPPL